MSGCVVEIVGVVVGVLVVGVLGAGVLGAGADLADVVEVAVVPAEVVAGLSVVLGRRGMHVAAH